MELDHDIDREEHEQLRHLNNFVRFYIEDNVLLKIINIYFTFKKKKRRTSILHLRSSSTLKIFVNLIFSHIVRNCGRLNQARSGSSGTTKRVVRKPNKLVSDD